MSSQVVHRAHDWVLKLELFGARYVANELRAPNLSWAAVYAVAEANCKWSISGYRQGRADI